MQEQKHVGLRKFELELLTYLFGEIVSTKRIK
jgi:hypothetical protein